MPPPSDRPLQKVTMNFFREDVAELVSIYGQGWTSEVRALVADHVRSHKALRGKMIFKGAQDAQ